MAGKRWAKFTAHRSTEIKTGFNEAFIIDRATRDRLVSQDASSAELLKPFLRGENIKRWRVESEDLWLINTPKGKVDIEQHPAIKTWLLRFKPELEKRATKQGWWELQQAQLAYQPKFEKRKILYPHFQNERIFSFEEAGIFSNDKSYIIPTDDIKLLSYLNSCTAWFFLVAISPSVRNEWHEMRVQYVETLPLPDLDKSDLNHPAISCLKAAGRRHKLQSEVQHRIIDLAPSELKKLTGKLENFHTLNFASFRQEIKQAFRAEIPVKERSDWETYLTEKGAEVRRLTQEIEKAEREIDATVYKLFDLNVEEIALLETSLKKQY